MSQPSSVSPRMVVGVVFVALIIIVMMFVFRRHGCDPLHMNTATQSSAVTVPSTPPSSTARNVWINLVNYKLPAEQKKITRVHPRKQGNTIVSLQEAITLCKKGGYCERVQTDGDNYIFVNWPSPFDSRSCPTLAPCPTCRKCPTTPATPATPTACSVDIKTGLPFWREMYRGGHKTEYINGVLYNDGILPYNQTTGYTLYPYNPYTGNRLIDKATNLPVAIDELGLARFSSDTMPWYAIVGMANDISDCVLIANSEYSVGARTGLPGRRPRGDDKIFLNLPITVQDLNSDFTLIAGFDKTKVQRWQEDNENLPKNPNGSPYVLPLYPFNPYTGNAIIDPVTSKPVEINAADGLAKFKPYSMAVYPVF
jgi:hypothetical protein